MGKIKILIMLILSITYISAYGEEIDKYNHEEHNHEEHNHEEDNHEEYNHEEHNHEEDNDKDQFSVIKLSSKKQKQLGITSEKLEKKRFNTRLSRVGKVIFDRTESEQILSNKKGQFRFNKNFKHIYKGRVIKKGDLIGKVFIKSTDEHIIVVKNLIKTSFNNYQFAKKEFKRISPLYKKDLISEKDFIKVSSNLENKKLKYQLALKKMELLQGKNTPSFSINSPIDGVITEIFITNNSFIDQYSPILTISPTDSKLVKVDLLQGDIDKISDIKSGFIYYQNKKIELELAPFKQIAIFNNLYSKIYLKSENLPNIGSKFMVNIVLNRSEGEKYVIKNSSILEIDGEKYIFIKKGDNFQLINISIKYQNSSETVIDQNLNNDFSIVTKGKMVLFRKLFKNLDNPHAGHNH